MTILSGTLCACGATVAAAVPSDDPKAPTRWFDVEPSPDGKFIVLGEAGRYRSTFDDPDGPGLFAAAPAGIRYAEHECRR